MSDDKETEQPAPEDATHDVDVPEGEIKNAFEAELGKEPATGDQGEAATPIDPEAERARAWAHWGDMSITLVGVIDGKVCPNWELKDQEKKDLSEAMAGALHQAFPGGMAGYEQWGPYAKLAFVVVMISVARFDWAEKELRPLLPEKPSAETADRASEAPTAGMTIEPEPNLPAKIATPAPAAKKKPKKKAKKKAVSKKRGTSGNGKAA